MTEPEKPISMAEVIESWAIQVLCEEANYAFDQAVACGDSRQQELEAYGHWLLVRAAKRAGLTLDETVARYEVREP